MKNQHSHFIFHLQVKKFFHVLTAQIKEKILIFYIRVEFSLSIRLTDVEVILFSVNTEINSEGSEETVSIQVVSVCFM